MSAQRDYGTSHLKRHLERCLLRPLEFRNEDDSDGDNYVFNMAELRADIINFIVEGAHSFSIVEENGFKRMMARANCNFVPFGRATVKRDLLSSYVVERDELKDMLSKVSGRVSLTTDNWKCNHTRQQFDMYLDDDVLDLNCELDILEFWHQSSVRYPVLSKMARDLLTIPVSIVASESAFSIGGKTISASRGSLKSKTDQALVCMQDWHRAKYNIEDTEEVDYGFNDEIDGEEEEDDVDPFF